jgi:hypothetical protein
LLYKLSELKFTISLIKLMSYFLSQIKFRVSVEDEMPTARDTSVQAGAPQDFVLSPTLYSIYTYIYINDTPQTFGVYLGPFADDN